MEYKIQPNKALQPTPIRFAPGVARTFYRQLITKLPQTVRSGWLSLTLGHMKFPLILFLLFFALARPSESQSFGGTDLSAADPLATEIKQTCFRYSFSDHSSANNLQRKIDSLLVSRGFKRSSRPAHLSKNGSFDLSTWFEKSINSNLTVYCRIYEYTIHHTILEGDIFIGPGDTVDERGQHLLDSLKEQISSIRKNTIQT